MHNLPPYMPPKPKGFWRKIQWALWMRSRENWEEARAQFERQQLRHALNDIKRAAVEHGVNAEVGAAIAHAEVVARQTEQLR